MRSYARRELSGTVVVVAAALFLAGGVDAPRAKWLFDSGRATGAYVASQGSALGRQGRVHVECDENGTIWVGGGTVICIEGAVEL